VLIVNLSVGLDGVCLIP